MHLLLVEDNVALVDELLPLFAAAGYATDWLADGRDAAALGGDPSFDLIVLDLGLPGRSGLEVLKEWRARGVATPVLILTARDTWAERIAGLKAGADDYLGKPFAPEELLLRIRALLRRTHGARAGETLAVGDLELDEAAQRCRRGGVEVALTGSEFRLLRYFMLSPGRVFTKLQLMEHLYDGETERDPNVIEVQVNRLRGKLGRELIETRRGQGYCLAAPA
jgi:two-component system OmpR family response regulator